MIFGKRGDTIKVAVRVETILQPLKVAQMGRYCEHSMLVLLVVNDNA